MNEKFIEGLSQQFSSLVNNLPKGGELPGQEQIKSLLQSALAKLDLVSRDEFDAQAAVLTRTRQKVEALEVRMAKLEQQLNNNSAG
ncbi:MAG: accessory factor UbiK family protein [Pseudomonadales bacterium]|nr:accessory factor UbiK family protein [Pseudomonadales bacterium]